MRCCRCERMRDSAFASFNRENVAMMIAVHEQKLSEVAREARQENSRLVEEHVKERQRQKRKRRNIIETIDGHMIVGDEDAVVDSGKVLVAAANPDLMESYIEEKDLVILGNRYESQLCAIEMSAGCIVVCEGAESAAVRLAVTQAVERYTGCGSDRITVLKMKTEAGN